MKKKELDGQKEDEEEEKDVFNIKIDIKEFVDSIKNLITHIPNADLPRKRDLVNMKNQANNYSSKVGGKIKSVIEYIDAKSDISNPIVRAIQGDTYYVVNNFNNVSNIYTGTFDSLIDNKIDPKKHVSQITTIFGIKVNDYLVFANNFMRLGKAFASGSNSLSDYFFEKLDKINLKNKSLVKEIIERLYINLQILSSLSLIINNSTASYGDLFTRISNSRTRSLKRQREPSQEEAGSESQKKKINLIVMVYLLTR